MTKKINILELNGKRYDADTGSLLGDADSHAPHAAASPKRIDGLIAPPKKTPGVTHAASAAKPAHHQPVLHEVRERTKPVTADVRRTPGPHTPAHQPEPSKTLMRHAVNAPAASLKRRAKTTSHTGSLVKAPAASIMPKLSFHSVDDYRLKRAQHIARSKLISRFGSLETPLLTRPQSHTASRVQPRTTSPAVHAASSAAVPNSSRQASHDIFERALAQANSHRQPPVPPRHKPAPIRRRVHHAASIAASSLAVLLIVGFIAYQNTANIQMRIASSRAGINATMPRWQPSGYAVGGFTYSPGTVAVNFHNTGNEQRNFSLTQTTSNWDSAALLSDFVSAENSSYNSIQADGRLIYTYGNNNATWVSGGIWYKLTTNGNLSTSQLVHLATST